MKYIIISDIGSVPTPAVSPRRAPEDTSPFRQQTRSITNKHPIQNFGKEYHENNVVVTYPVGTIN